MKRRTAPVLLVALALGAFAAAPAAADPTFEGSCHGYLVSGAVLQYGGGPEAIEALGFPSIKDAQAFVRADCG